MKWFLTSKFWQWITLTLFNHWVHIKKNDERFVVGNKIPYEGNNNVPPTTPFTNREIWHTVVVFQLPPELSTCYIAVDDVFGNRLACLGRPIRPGEMVALRVGHEPATAFFIAYKGAANPPRIEFVCRCHEDKLSTMKRVICL